MDLGHHLYTLKGNEHQNTLFLIMNTGRWEKRPFNPDVIVSTPWAITPEGREKFYRTHQARWGAYPDETNGNKVGEGFSDEILFAYCQKNGLEIPQRGPTGMAATVGDMSSFDIAKYDCFYVARGFDTAWHGVIVPRAGIRSNIITGINFPGSSPVVPNPDLEEIDRLSTKISTLDAKLGNMKMEISELIEDIDDMDFPARGGGKWVSKLKSVRSELQSLL